MCGGDDREVVHVYAEPPEGEIRFAFEGPYRRELRRCLNDGHIVSVHGMDMSELYAGAYVDATYGNDGMRRTYERVLALPLHQSDNAGRVARVLEFMEPRRRPPQPSLLDIGSGTGVFPNRMQSAGWSVVASDPDARAVSHLREVAKVEALELDFGAGELQQLGTYDVVTLNKVLEHVVDPVVLLARARSVLAPNGVVYLEVPDVEAAQDPSGYGREEFFIDHFHVFSAMSAEAMAAAAGYVVLDVERLREPSTKYTIRLFLAVA